MVEMAVVTGRRVDMAGRWPSVLAVERVLAELASLLQGFWRSVGKLKQGREHVCRSLECSGIFGLNRLKLDARDSLRRRAWRRFLARGRIDGAISWPKPSFLRTLRVADRVSFLIHQSNSAASFRIGGQESQKVP